MYLKTLELRDRLRELGLRMVLAESCTAGRVAAELGWIPGISEFFCGAFVVYRNDSKTRWLNIDPDRLADPGPGPVSPEVTAELARQALVRTPEATVAAAITGHLGPSAPCDGQGASLDGTVYGCLVRADTHFAPKTIRWRLESPPPSHAQDWHGRYARQDEAARKMIDFLIEELGSTADRRSKP